MGDEFREIWKKAPGGVVRISENDEVDRAQLFNGGIDVRRLGKKGGGLGLDAGGGAGAGIIGKRGMEEQGGFTREKARGKVKGLDGAGCG